MEREVKVIKIECPFCGYKDFSKTKDKISDDTGFCEGVGWDAWDCPCCGERTELGLDSLIKEAKDFKHYAENSDWEGLLRFCLGEEYDDLTLVFLAKYYLKNKEWKKAEKIAEILLKIDPEDFDGQIIIERIKRKDYKIRINATANQLIDAFQCCNLERPYFLNLKKKELVSYAPDLNMVEEALMRKELNTHPENFLKIPLQNSKDNFNLMESFIHEIGEHQGQTRVAEVLSTAIQKSKPFRSFKEALLNFPKAREQWFAFERSVYKEIALDWVCENNLICRSGNE